MSLSEKRRARRLRAIGRAIRYYRETANGVFASERMTQRELADRLGVSVASIARWEAGDVEVGAAMFLELCQQLGVAPALVFDQAATIERHGD